MAGGVWCLVAAGWWLVAGGRLCAAENIKWMLKYTQNARTQQYQLRNFISLLRNHQPGMSLMALKPKRNGRMAAT